MASSLASFGSGMGCFPAVILESGKDFMNSIAELPQLRAFSALLLTINEFLPVFIFLAPLEASFTSPALKATFLPFLFRVGQPFFQLPVFI